MDDQELAELSKKDNTIIVFAFGNKYAFKMAYETETYLDLVLKRVNRRLKGDFNKGLLRASQLQTFSMNVESGSTMMNCPDKTCIHTFSKTEILIGHVKANHPILYSQLVQSEKIKIPVQTISYL